MNRRQQLENIIVGTLLESNAERNYFDDCRSTVTSGMFLDDTNRRIYGLISEMNNKGMTNTDPCSIFTEYGEAVLDIVSRMCELCTDYSFIHQKFMYNEWQYLKSCINDRYYEPTSVQFEDYVKQFIKSVYEDEAGN